MIAIVNFLIWGWSLLKQGRGDPSMMVGRRRRSRTMDLPYPIPKPMPAPRGGAGNPSARSGASLHAFVPCLAWTYCAQLYFGDRLMDLIYKSTATRQQQLSSYPQPSHSHHVLSRLRLVLHFPPRPSCVPARHRGRASHQGRSRDTDEHICGVHNWGKRSHALRSGLANKSTECWRPSTPAGIRSGNHFSSSERAPC